MVKILIPYEYFKRACQTIKSVYSAANKFEGYHRYMQFWAKNGAYNWICDFSEYDGERAGVRKVKYTYLETAFWNNYKGTTSPLEKPTEEDTKSIIWKEPEEPKKGVA